MTKIIKKLKIKINQRLNSKYNRVQWKILLGKQGG